MVLMSIVATQFFGFDQLIALSLSQDGSDFPFFAHCVYDYICGNSAASKVKATIEEVPDVQTN